MNARRPAVNSVAQTPIGVVVVSGGAARRFGADKCAAEVGGVTLLERVVAAAHAAFGDSASVVVVGPWAPPGTTVLVERTPGGGPLAAIAAGAAALATRDVIVLAGDLAHVSPAMLDWLAVESPGAEAVVPVRAGRPQYLFARYARGAALEVAMAALADGRRRASELAAALAVVWCDESVWGDVEPAGDSFDDVDTPADLDRVLRSEEPIQKMP